MVTYLRVLRRRDNRIATDLVFLFEVAILTGPFPEHLSLESILLLCHTLVQLRRAKSDNEINKVVIFTIT